MLLPKSEGLLLTPHPASFDQRLARNMASNSRLLGKEGSCGGAGIGGPFILEPIGASSKTIQKHYLGAVLNLRLFLCYFTYLALALAPSCAFQGLSAKSCPNIILVYFPFHEACVARVAFTIYRVFICRHLFPRFSELFPQLE